MRHLTDLALVVGATLRATRFITTDSLGYWSIVRPARRWAHGHDDPTRTGDDAPDPDAGWRSKLVSGLDCPFCVGYWLGAATLGSYWLARRSPGTLAAWRAVASTLALNYLTGHVSARIEEISHDDE